MNIMHVLVSPLAVMGIMGGVFGVLLASAAVAFRVKRDERITNIRALLPGANCGGCGYPGCDGYAEGIVNDGVAPNKCVVAKGDIAAKIGDIMGVSVEASVPMRAFVKCRGTCAVSPRQIEYYGIHDCASAAAFPGGSPVECTFGCMGFGTCVKSCTFGALSIGPDGLPVVDASKCVGCGACVNVCPRGVLSLVPQTADVIVACNSHWKGPMVRKVCTAGCIACGMCAKNCPAGAITIEGDLAVIDQSKCIDCGKCAAKCPVKCIVTAQSCKVRKDIA